MYIVGILTGVKKGGLSLMIVLACKEHILEVNSNPYLKDLE